MNEGKFLRVANCGKGKGERKCNERERERGKIMKEKGRVTNSERKGLNDVVVVSKVVTTLLIPSHPKCDSCL